MLKAKVRGRNWKLCEFSVSSVQFSVEETARQEEPATPEADDEWRMIGYE